MTGSPRLVYDRHMCGRFASALPPEMIARIFRTRGVLPNAGPSWNIAPSNQAMVVRRHPEAGERRLDLLTWGFLPHWTKDLRNSRQPINARAETVATSRMFRDAFARRRGLVPADAFYEWQKRDGAPKQPYAIARADGRPLALAGIWEGWRGPGHEIIRSFAIIVTEANAEMAPIHDRMPVIIEEADWPAWLGETEADATELLRPAAAGVLRIWPVSTRVNRPANNDEQVLEPVELSGEAGS